MLFIAHQQGHSVDTTTAAPTVPTITNILLDARMNLDPILLDRVMGGDILLEARMNLDPILLDKKLSN